MRKQNRIKSIYSSCAIEANSLTVHQVSDIINGKKVVGPIREIQEVQNAILGYYNPLFYWIPLENYIKDYQEEYYRAISISHKNGSSTVFIEYMLEMIFKIIVNIEESINNHTNHISSYVEKLLGVMEETVPMSAYELMGKLGLKSKETFRKNYLNPAIDANLVEYEIKDKPTSKNQRYIKR